MTQKVPFVDVANAVGFSCYADLLRRMGREEAAAEQEVRAAELTEQATP